VTVACIGLSLVYPAVLIALLACFGLNLAMRFRLWNRMSSFLEPARELDALLVAGRRLAAPPLSLDRATTEGLGGALARLGRMPRAVSWLALDRTSINELAAIVFEYLNVFLLLDVNAFVLTVDLLRRHRGVVRRLYESIGRVDAALSVASLRAGAASFGRPEIDDAGPLAIEDLVHPLVPDAVPNSLSLADRGLFITGSNMSGKSTFLKAVGVNVILAQALGTTFAERYRAPFLTVRTLIVGADSITEGKSYYLAEVVAALERLQAIGEDGEHLVLVDEIFRGTNTEERIGAGKAYLEALVRRGALVIAASHDRELGGLLVETFQPKHFTERVEGDEVVFDYTLREGACPTRNAIRILEIAGFSSEIVEEARRVAGWLAERAPRYPASGLRSR
jgi:DNA mismatch repair ATPase MutS